jgi:hypothetical protein
VNAADFLVGAGGSQLGSLEAGMVGSLTTPVISALSGGLLTIVGAVAIGVALPSFRGYRSPALDRSGEQPQTTVNERINSCSEAAVLGPEREGA